MNLNLLLGKLGISTQLTQDISLIIVILLLSFIYGMLLGKHKLMSVLVNIYVSFAVVSVIPEKIFKAENQKVLAFIILLVILTFISRKIFDISFASGGSALVWRVFVVSFLQVALVLSIVLSFISKKEALVYVSANAYNYLVFGWAPFFWMIIPLVVMFLLYRKSKY